jgi:hypothetical protein
LPNRTTVQLWSYGRSIITRLPTLPKTKLADASPHEFASQLGKSMSQYYQKPHRGARGIAEYKPQLYEKFAVRALVAVVTGRDDGRRHIRKARTAARRAEATARERRERADRREQIDRAVELSRDQRRKAARI